MTTQAMLQQTGTQLLFADHATDFGAAPATPANSLIIGTPTDVQWNPGGDAAVLAAAAAWESAKTATLAHTGTAWPEYWTFGACMESTATPAAGGTFDFYWNPSPNATPGVGNSGGASGTDLTFAVAGLPQLMWIGALTVQAAVINIDAAIGRVYLPYLYGSLIIVNSTSVATVADHDNDEIHAVATPTFPDSQAAA